MPEAARVGDLHACPALTVVIPHVGGPTLPPGATSMTADGRNVTLMADQASCLGPVDVVVEGSASVIVDGLPVARKGDHSAHSGVIVMGSSSVEIGGPTLRAVKAGANTYVAYDPDRGQMYVVSYIQYTGPDASPAYADAAAGQIEAMWGGPRVVRGKATDVHVKVHTHVNKDGDMLSGYDEVRVDASQKRSNQALGGGAGNWRGNQNPKDVAPKTYVAAHEYGHTLGLVDQYKDTPTGSVPDPTKTSNLTQNIMCQTWPDPGTGAVPHPYAEHYDDVLSRAGL